MFTCFINRGKVSTPRHGSFTVIYKMTPFTVSLTISSSILISVPTLTASRGKLPKQLSHEYYTLRGQIAGDVKLYHPDATRTPLICDPPRVVRVRWSVSCCPLACPVPSARLSRAVRRTSSPLSPLNRLVVFAVLDHLLYEVLCA